MHNVNQLLVRVVLLLGVNLFGTYRNDSLLLLKEVDDQLGVLDVVAGELPERGTQLSLALVAVVLRVFLCIEKLPQLMLELALSQWHDEPGMINLKKKVSI